MNEFFTLAQIDRITEVIRSKITRSPKAGIILGSGLGGLADSIAEAEIIPYVDLPSWPVSTVQGHQGRLVVGKLEGRDVLVMQGRTHYYEGYNMAQVGLPVRVMQRLGVEILIVTNAAGSVNPEFGGDLDADHLPSQPDRNGRLESPARSQPG
jgi:purine-nucleoside phosphorylase